MRWLELLPVQSMSRWPVQSLAIERMTAEVESLTVWATAVVRYPPPWLQAHEYIHTLQYQADAAQFIDYAVETLRSSQPRIDLIESIARVWAAWTRAYGKWELEPWQIWRPL